MSHANGSTRLCAWCDAKPIPPDAPPKARFCSTKCRQGAFRARRDEQVAIGNRKAKRLAYADPPYPFLHRKRYDPHPEGEVDHRKLILKELPAYDGWALSTSVKALPHLLPLLPKHYVLCPWVKPIAANPKTYGIHNCTEYLIVVPGRRLRPAKRDFLIAQPARNGGDVVGRKPQLFVHWMLDLLGAIPGLDQLDDLYPGSGIVTRAWREASRAAAANGGVVL